MKIFHVACLLLLSTSLVFALPVRSRVRGTPASELVEVSADPNPCDGVCCGDYGHCEVRDGEGVCVCHDNYVGATCENEHPCTGVECGEHGDCVVTDEDQFGNGSGVCFCAPGWIGDACETPNTECEGDFTEWSDCSATCEEGFSYRTFVVTTAKSGWGCECDFEDGHVEQKDCFLRMCPIDCEGYWGEYGLCSQTCEEGTKTRNYIVTVEAQYGGKECPITEDAKCNLGECPIDCVGEWSGYDSCSTTCNPGYQTKTYNVSVPAQHGGLECPEDDGTLETQDCNDGYDDVCAIHCEGSWGSFDTCNVTCGGGRQTQTYNIAVNNNHKGNSCPHDDGATFEQDCNTQGCPVDCVGAWGSFTTCSATCGGGEQTQTFTVTVPEANGGLSCLEQFGATDGEEFTQTCNSHNCPEHCEGKWGDFGACSVTCSTGSIYRTFSVTAEARYGGLECDYNDGDVDTESCDAGPCPVDCVGSFGGYDDCANEDMCGTGSQTRTFSVSQVELYGGASCSHADGAEETRSCELVPCPIDCEGAYGLWSSCSVTCATGYKTRDFEVTVEPQYGGAPCPGTETAECNDRACPIDCVGEWGLYGSCTTSCGEDGEQYRYYGVIVEAAHGGAECDFSDGESQSQACNIFACPDICHGVCCGDYGHCVNGTCECYHGWTGPACEIEIVN